MTITKTRTFAALVAACALAITGCGDDDTSTDDAADIEETADDTAGESSGDGADDEGDDEADEGDGDADQAPGGGGGGALVFDGETIELGPGRCFLEEQPAAAGGGSILATAQATGTNAAGEEVGIDFTRFSEESMFAGDDVNVYVGEIATAVSYTGSAPEGTVSIDGGVVSAEDFSLTGDEGGEVTISFGIDCG